jgi:hypothetical protein
MVPVQVNRRLRIAYTIVALLLVLWLACMVAFAASFEPEMYFFSYYSVDYTFGFVRRGLAGEILDLFPADLYFIGLTTLRWLVSALFVISLLAVARTVAVSFGRSERRWMLAVLIPVLPFGFAFAIFCPHPDLVAGAVLATFAVVLASVKEDRSVLLASAAYGFTTALLTLIHEAIPLLFSLGAVVAVVSLAAHSSINTQRRSAFLAVVPGLAVMLAIGLLGRRGISSQLCALVPHRAVDWPAAGKLTWGQIFSGQHVYVDYHDWVCRNIIKRFDQTPSDAAEFVASVGAGPLISSMVYGMFVFAVTALAIRYISGVPLRRFCNVLRGRLVWVTLAALLILPAFATGVDWIRWWVTIAFDLGVVYLVYASSQIEADQPLTSRTRLLASAGLILLAVFPIGVIPNLGIEVPV